MLKGIVVALLCIFIICTSTFTFFYLSFHSNISALNSVNTNSRRTFRQNRFLRTIFHLADRGDARNDYFEPNPYSKLVFEIYSGTNGTLYPSSIDLLENGLSDVINKPGGISIVENNLNDIPSAVDTNYLDNLENTTPKYSSNTAVMRIYLLSSLQKEPDILGQTIGAYSFAIFKKSIEKNETGSVSQDLEKEVILHEIGHLLGAEHTTNEGCIMSQFVDSTDTFTLTFTPTSYCTSDIGAIRAVNY